jgi:phosphonate transport system permease protein
VVGALLSLILPGLGQAWQGAAARGLGIFVLAVTGVAITAWYAQPVWYIVPAALWLWNVWDALTLPAGAPVWMAVLVWIGMVYGIGWQVTEINPAALFSNGQRAASILRPMLRPDFVAARENRTRYTVTVQAPCSAKPPEAKNTIGDVVIEASPSCVAVGENIIIMATGLKPNAVTEVTWITPTGGVIMLGENRAKMMTVETDASGKLTTMFPIPTGIGISDAFSLPGYTLSVNGRYILQGIYETLALAFLATVLGAILALPLSFLAARNLMSASPVSYALYVVVRTLLNIFRSIEALILAIIFVIIVGLGPFPGMLALTVHTTAALGKLYSEVIEGIDSGPIEAVRAVGATWLQIVRFAVIPQIVPSFTALTIYRWDINVRSSTIIGFVGGGGIGFFLWQWILLGDYRAVSASFITIAVVVILMDYFSAQLRAQLQ